MKVPFYTLKHLLIKDLEESINYFYKNKYWFDLLDIIKEFSQYLYKQRKYKLTFDYLNIELTATQFVYKERPS